MIISTGAACNIPAGHDSATVTNQDPIKNGSYEITGDGIAINKQIDGGETQNTQIFKNSVTVTNLGKTDLDVDNCLRID